MARCIFFFPLFLFVSCAVAADVVPDDVTLGEVVRETRHNRRVRTVAEVYDIFPDDVDRDYQMLLLRDGEENLLASIRSDFAADRLLGAKVRVVGRVSCLPIGRRSKTGNVLLVESAGGVEVVEPLSADFFDTPSLRPETMPRDPLAISRLGRRSVEGIVIASWRPNNMLVMPAGDSVNLHQVALAEGIAPPCAGSRVKVVGTVETDLVRYNLTRARIKVFPDKPKVVDYVGYDWEYNASRDVNLFFSNLHKGMFVWEYLGRSILVEGIVKEVPSLGLAGVDFAIESHDISMAVRFGSGVDRPEWAVPGAKVAIRGVVVYDIENWRPTQPLPLFTGVSIVVPENGRIELVKHAPWWTTGRLAAAIFILIAVFVSVIVFQRVLARMLLRRRMDERMRLAVELHDTITQLLTGAVAQIRSAERAIQVGIGAQRYMELSRSMVDAARNELRNCIWDLRNRALEEPTVPDAIRTTLSPVAKEVKVAIRFAVPRERFTDRMLHAVLSIVRELVVNAVRHGGARSVGIAGAAEGRMLKFSVTDDGCGFDPSSCPGMDEGHFGLEGVRERLAEFDGSLEIESSPGAGTHAEVTMTFDKGVVRE